MAVVPLVAISQQVLATNAMKSLENASAKIKLAKTMFFVMLPVMKTTRDFQLGLVDIETRLQTFLEAQTTIIISQRMHASRWMATHGTRSKFAPLEII